MRIGCACGVEQLATRLGAMLAWCHCLGHLCMGLAQELSPHGASWRARTSVCSVSYMRPRAEQPTRAWRNSLVSAQNKSLTLCACTPIASGHRVRTELPQPLLGYQSRAAHVIMQYTPQCRDHAVHACEAGMPRNMARHIRDNNKTRKRRDSTATDNAPVYDLHTHTQLCTQVQYS